MSTTIERLAPPDRPDAARVLADALHHEPGFVSVIPDDARRAAIMRVLLGILVRDAAPLGNVWVARSGGEVAGAAIWYAPGDFPMTAWRQVRVAPAMLPLLRYGRHVITGLGQMEENAKAAFPKEPCWYLAAFGVDPARQGEGIGSQLMERVLAGIDADGAAGRAAYLETGEQVNVGFYRRFGFEVREDALQLAPQPGPTHWTMWRPPAGPPSASS